MPTLLLENVPASLFEHIQRLASARKDTPADTAVAMLEKARRTTDESDIQEDRSSGKIVNAVWVPQPLPQEPFLSEEICSPFTLPRPEGKRVFPVEVPQPLAIAHDFPDEEE